MCECIWLVVLKMLHTREIEQEKKINGFFFDTDLESPALLASAYKDESLNNLIDCPTTN